MAEESNYLADLLLDIQSNSMPEPLKKTRETYFTEFTDKMFEYNELAPPGEQLTPEQQIKHMVNFLRTNKELNGVAQNMNVFTLTKGRLMTYDEAVDHVNIGIAQADDQDGKDILRTRERVKSRKKVYFAGREVSDDDYIVNQWQIYHLRRAQGSDYTFADTVEREFHRMELGKPTYDEADSDDDYDNDGIVAYRSERDIGIRIEGDAWDKLSSRDKQGFRTISAEGRRNIAEYFSQNPPPSANAGTPSTAPQGRPGSKSRNQRRGVNISELAEVVDEDSPAKLILPPTTCSTPILDLHLLA